MDFKKVFFAGTILSLMLTVVYLRFPGIRFLMTAMKKVGMEKFDDNNGTRDSINKTCTEISLLKIKNTEKLEKTTETIERKNLSLSADHDKSQDAYKLVLFYTPVFGSMPWSGLKNTHDFTHPRGKPCKIMNCRITYDKKYLSRSDAVVFHGRDVPDVNTMKDISRNRNWKQRWVLFTQENPYYTYLDTEMYNGFFNWTMTYRRDSDLFVPYRYYSPLNSTEKATIQVSNNYARGKDKFIAWMVSNCGRIRDKVTSKLLKYVNVTVFGDCAQNFGQSNRCDKESVECEKLLRRFKFYLSFENANCIDYVTEKYWYTPFLYDMVPIVLGPLKYDSRIAIPGSYINVMDFPSLEDLASYLKYLDKNETAYNQYFEWKLEYKFDYPNPWSCEMCAKLNNPNLPAKVYDDLGSFWGKNNTCGLYEDRVKKLL